MSSPIDNGNINSSVLSTLAMNANDESNPQANNDTLLNISAYLGDLLLHCCNELFSRSIQDSGQPNVNSITGSKNSRKPRKTYLDKDNGLLYRNIQSIANKLFEIHSSRPDEFVKFNESKINASRRIDCMSKWIINNRKSAGSSSINDTLHPEIDQHMGNLPQHASSDNTTCALSQKLILWKAYQQWSVLEPIEKEHVAPNTRIRIVALALSSQYRGNLNALTGSRVKNRETLDLHVPDEKARGSGNPYELAFSL